MRLETMANQMGKRLLLALLYCSCTALARQADSDNRFATLTKTARKLDGFLPLYWDEHAGKMLIEVEHLNQEMLYVTALSAGVGSNDLGLNRGRVGRA